MPDPNPERWRVSLIRAGSSPEEIAEIAWNVIGGGINRDARNIARRREIAGRLREQGKSFPEIAEAIGYRSHNAVRDLLKREVCK